jgi:hypothetical protein
MAGKGRPKTGGRQKGTPNKLTADVKAMVLEALDKAGGVAYLLTQAQTNPNAFLTLVGKVLPMTLAGDPDNPVAVQAIERRIVKPAE